MQRYNYKIIILCIFIMLVSVNISTGTEPFTELAIGSKSYAMGQTATISYTDLFGSFNSPANLSQSNTITSAFYYSSPTEDTKIMRFGFSFPMKGRGTIGFNYFRFVVDDILLRNSFGESQGKSSYIQHEYAISYGRKLSDKIQIGLNGKWIADEFTNVDLNESDVKNIGLDFSLGYLPNFENAWLKGLGFGFALKNFVQLNSNDDQIPREYRLIAENRYINNKNSIHLAINYLWHEYHSSELNSRLHIGLEYGYDYVFFRIGHNDDRLTAGAGVNIRFLSFDYGYGISQKNRYFNPDQHNFTISLIL